MRKPDPANRFRRTAPDASARTAEADATPARGLTVFAALLLSLALLWLIFRVSIANAVLEVRPDLAAAIAPRHPEAALSRLGRAGAGGAEEYWFEAMRAFGEAPLSEEPLLVGLQRATAEGEMERADRLLDELYRRNPRSRYALLLMLDRQFRENRMADATRTLASLIRLLPNSRDLLVRELARMSRNPGVGNAIRYIVGRDERIRTALLEELGRQGADPELVLELAGSGPGDAGEGTPRWQRLLLDALISNGEISQARDTWEKLSGAEPGQSGVYDPNFAGLPGPPPFNWHLEAGEDGFAEFTQGSPGLYAEHYARGDAVLASQLIMLSHGRYRLSVEAEGDAGDSDSGGLAWTISCHPGRRTIGTIPIAGIDFTPKTISGTFEVPAGCRAQWLRLTGKFGEFPEDQQVTLRQLRITQAEGS